MRIITPEDLDTLFYDAFLTDQRLPAPYRKQKLTMQLDMNRIDWLNYVDDNPNSLPPTARSISRWELALELVQLIKREEDRQLIWLRGKRLSWSKMGRLIGIDRRKVKLKHSELMMTILILIKLMKDLHRKDKIYRLIAPKYE